MNAHTLSQMILLKINWLEQLAVGIGIFLAFWVVAVIVKAIISKCDHKLSDTRKPLLMLLGRIAKSVLLIIGLITALGSMGVNVNALVASLGLTGFALGFATKDALSNVLAGILILFYQPFKVGDEIMILSMQGVVQSINLRYTELHLDDKRILVPNSSVLINSITVLSSQSI